MAQIKQNHEQGSLKAITERYAIVVSYLNYESSVLWQRTNFFLVASTALFGVASLQGSQVLSNPSWQSGLTLGVTSVFGLLICRFWYMGFLAGRFWIHHWHKNLKELEEEAFGSRCLLRNFQPDTSYPPNVRATNIIRDTIYLFLVIWLIILALSTVTVSIKLIQ